MSILIETNASPHKLTILPSCPKLCKFDSEETTKHQKSHVRLQDYPVKRLHSNIQFIWHRSEKRENKKKESSTHVEIIFFIAAFKTYHLFMLIVIHDLSGGKV